MTTSSVACASAYYPHAVVGQCRGNLPHLTCPDRWIDRCKGQYRKWQSRREAARREGWSIGMRLETLGAVVLVMLAAMALYCRYRDTRRRKELLAQQLAQQRSAAPLTPNPPYSAGSS